MDARRTLTLLPALLLGLALLAGCAPDGWPREAAAAPTAEEPPYPPPPTATPAPTDPIRGYPLPPATPEGRPSRTPTPTRTPPVTPTEIPFPTPIPTPVVTPIPLAEPPFIPEAAGREPEVFTLVYRAGDTVWAVQSDGTGDRVLLDLTKEPSSEPLAVDGGLYSWQKQDLCPDGRWLALVVDGDIHLFDVETGASRVLVENAVEPVWSPDGTRLAYRDVATGGLWVLEVTTGETRELYAVQQSEDRQRWVTGIAWSPDSRQLCFMEEVPTQEYALLVVDVEGTTPPVVVVAPSVYGFSVPKWSPRGDRILIVRSSERTYPSGPLRDVWSVAPDGSSFTQLTHDMVTSTALWSPDGEWIAFGGIAPYESEESDWDLWLLSSDGSVLRRITAGETGLELLSLWSPDGVALLFWRTNPFDPSTYDLWVLNLADGSERVIQRTLSANSWMHAVKQ